MAKLVVKQRVCAICYPHNTPVCHTGKDSFLHLVGCWRTASKLQVLLVILMTVLRGYSAENFQIAKSQSFSLFHDTYREEYVFRSSSTKKKKILEEPR